jgi:hypothetical protein
MVTETLSLNEALDLESKGDIKIYQHHDIASPLDKLPESVQWKQNWEEVRKKYRKVNLTKLPKFLDFEYQIEYKFREGEDPIVINWVYLYAKDIKELEKIDQAASKGQYVYILTNVAYPNLCKIGKAVSPQKRIKQINGAGVVVEWELKYAIPVVDDYKVEHMIHQNLEAVRMDSFQGSSREFFNISFNEAIKVVEGVAKDFQNGEPTYY